MANLHFPPALGDVASRLFDPLTTTASELQFQMTSGNLTSRAITEQYLQQIREYDDYLHAIQAITPNVLDQADEMDALRKKGRVLGPLHGVPVLLKDNIVAFPELDMETTAGAAALRGSRAESSATIVDMLQRNGAVILGKATLSELGFWKGSGLPCGWSATGGQSQNPYIEGGYDASDTACGHTTPAGSSSGPAIAISAGLIPIAVGAETIGSLVTPALRQSLYTIKPTHGIVPSDGVVPLCSRFDSAGPMAKSVIDLANLLTAIVDPSKTDIPKGGYASHVLGHEGGSLHVGTLDPGAWRYNESMFKEGDRGFDQIERDTRDAYARIQKFAHKFHENIPLRSDADFALDGKNVTIELFFTDFNGELDEFLASLKESNVRSLEEMIKWNEEHASEALTPYSQQDLLIKSLETNATASDVTRLVDHMKEVGKSFVEMFDKLNLDIIVGPGDSWLCTHAAAMGAPVGVMPMSYLDFNGRPIGLMAAARPHEDAKLIQFMSAWEDVAVSRKPPKAFLQKSSL